MGSGSFTLTVFGTGFASPYPPYAGAVVQWRKGGEVWTNLPTNYVGDTQLTATVAASLITTTGAASIRVRNETAATPGFSNIMTLNVVDQVTITTGATLPEGNVGVLYQVELKADGGTLPYNWSVVEGALPPGLTLGSTNGIISGTPTSPGPYSFQVVVYDTMQVSDSQVFSILIRDDPLSILTASQLPNATLNEFFTTSLQARGGRPPYTWRVTSGSVPPGLTFYADGIINGRPTVAGQFTFQAAVQDQTQTQLTREFKIWVIGPLSITTISPLAGGASRERRIRRCSRRPAACRHTPGPSARESFRPVLP